MTKDDFKKTIDSINPDAHMTSRLKAKISADNVPLKRNRQVFIGITAVCLTAAIVFCVGFSALQPKDDSLVKSTVPIGTILQNKQINSFVMVASAAKGENTQTQITYKTLELDKEYPCEIYLSVKDISGLTEDEKTKLIQEISNNAFNKHCTDKNFKKGHSQVCTTDRIILSQCGLNEFKFNPDNTKNIKTVNVKNTSKYGQIVFTSGMPDFDVPPHGNDITVDGEDFDVEKSGFYWDHTEEAEKAFDENINTPFSTFNDTITFIVEYTDGSEAIGVIDLIFNDSGNATAICKNYDYVS